MRALSVIQEPRTLPPMAPSPKKPPRPAPSAIGRAIARLRHAKGWSQEKLAEEAGIGRVTIARLESGARQTGSPDTLRAIATALEVPIAAVMGEAVGVEGIGHLIEQFKQSPWALTMKPPPTEEDYARLRSLGDAVWTRMPPTPEAVYHVILALRATDNSTGA